MKKMKKLLYFALICCLVSIPAIQTKAATQPATPGGLGVYSQDNKKIAVDFTFDSNLPYYSPENPASFGYEVTVSNLKGKVINIFNTNTDGSSFLKEDDNTLALLLRGKKYMNQGFKFKVRSFVCDQYNQPVYSEYSKEKVVIPRPVVHTLKALSKSSGKITWNKIKGAKKYTVYLSNNNGKKYKKYKSTSSNSLVINNMQLDKYYTVYVMAEDVKYNKKKLKSTKTKEKNSGAKRIRIYTRYY